MILNLLICLIEVNINDPTPLKHENYKYPRTIFLYH